MIILNYFSLLAVLFFSQPLLANESPKRVVPKSELLVLMSSQTLNGELLNSREVKVKVSKIEKSLICENEFGDTFFIVRGRNKDAYYLKVSTPEIGTVEDVMTSEDFLDDNFLLTQLKFIEKKHFWHTQGFYGSGYFTQRQGPLDVYDKKLDEIPEIEKGSGVVNSFICK